ncbi:extracellular solute-binding protein [Saccharopolyspora rhizosphaerae]|uniref:Extracellular solute-binding protein n=1 Tax=Saccharopolyspora rhizosphaerae TaxID=2492662 RepID=A0A3R8Q7S3_9PSEU|nr:extracellular solute-binding protein [Saccharopolyspora rhizosphaerae]RRO20403.1 extracellular solute-binding protein [Saccharopolyspora rhizosphaerae]
MRGLRRLCAMGAAVALALTSTGCAVLLPPSQGSADVLTSWAISGGGEEELMPVEGEKFQQRTGRRVQTQFFQNDPYKNKLWVSMGSGTPPDTFFGWGGGALQAFIDAGKAADLAPTMREHPEWRANFLPSVMSPVDIDGGTYGIPIGGIQPVLLYFNKDVYAATGLQPPRTWNELLHQVPRLQQAGYLPIALGGADAWTYLMWEEAVVDRVAGPEAFQAVLDGEPGAWLNPDIIKANTMLQELVRTGAFGDAFASTSAELGQQRTLLASGRAAMMVHLGSGYSDLLGDDEQWVREGHLGWARFPAVEGGKGHADNLVGNPTTFMSATAGPDQQAAVDFLRQELSSPDYTRGTLERGDVPPVTGMEDELRASEDADYMTFVYELAKNAPHFQQSWDQALPPGPAQNVLINLQKLFLDQISPEEFSQLMEESSR